MTLGCDVVANAYGPNYRTGAGGGVSLTCGTLKGDGNISVRGGKYSDYYAGGGGRIAVVQTLATDFSAYGGTLDAGSYFCGPGTVYTKCAGSAGRISVGNAAWYDTGRTDFPMADDGDAAKAYRETELAVTTNAIVNILSDVMIRDLDLMSETSKLRLNGHTVTVRTPKHKGGRGWGRPGWTAKEAYAALVTEDGGRIVWLQGLALIIR